VRSGSVILNRFGRPVIAAAIAVLAVGCVPPEEPPPTTVAPTTSTTVVTPPDCDDYTPTGVAVSNTTPAPGDTIIVSGNGALGSTINVNLRSVADGTTVNPFPPVTATVAGDGTWSASLTIPGFLSGEFDVVATAEGDCAATARIDIG
jgi:hypothetical protein